MMRITGELHMMLSRFHGHAPSADCWCEPVNVTLQPVDGYPGLTRVIDHNDTVNEHHLVTLNRRGLEDDYATRFLNEINLDYRSLD